MKDKIINYANEYQYDGLFLIDSDVMVHPNTLQRLWKEDKEIISNIFWTQWQKDKALLPQVWMMDEYKLYEIKNGEKLEAKDIQKRTLKFLDKMKTPGVYEVGGLGACTMIRREALIKGVRFKNIKNLSF